MSQPQIVDTQTHQVTYWISQKDGREDLEVQLTDPNYKDYLCPTRELIPAQVKILPNIKKEFDPNTVAYLRYRTQEHEIKVASNI